MARNSKAGSKRKPVSKPTAADSKGRLRRGRRKVCQFCAQHSEWVDYKDINTLRRYMNDRGRIRARGATGTCRQHQRDVAVAIKTARELALLPYALRSFASGPGERRGGPRTDRSSAPASAEQEATATALAEPDDVSDETDPEPAS
jgi:small subunit ribosomal protein S18